MCLENKDLKHQLEIAQRQQQKLVANAMQQLEGQQADLTRQMANDLEKIMQKHQSEMQELQTKLQEREEALSEMSVELERTQKMNREYEEEIAKLRKEKEEWGREVGRGEKEEGNGVEMVETGEMVELEGGKEENEIGNVILLLPVTRYAYILSISLNINGIYNL